MGLHWIYPVSHEQYKVNQLCQRDEPFTANNVFHLQIFSSSHLNALSAQQVHFANFSFYHILFYFAIIDLFPIFLEASFYKLKEFGLLMVNWLLILKDWQAFIYISYRGTRCFFIAILCTINMQ